MNKIYSFLLLLFCVFGGCFAAAQDSGTGTMTYRYEFQRGVKVFQGVPVSAIVANHKCKQYKDVLNGKIWTLSSDNGIAFIDEESDRLQIGLSSRSPGFLVFQTYDFEDYTVKSVTVKACQGNVSEYGLMVYAGGVRYYCNGKNTATLVKASEGMGEYKFELNKGGSYKNGLISVAFTNTSGSAPFWVQSIEVEYVLSKAPAELSFDGVPSLNWFVDGSETFNVPTLLNPHLLDVTYSSDDESVATVDANSGVVTLAGALGRAVISARSEGDETYAPAKASYMIVVKKEDIGYAYRKVVSQEDIIDKGVYVLVCEGASYAMGAFSNDHMKAEDVNLEDDMYVGKTNVTGVPYEIILEKDKNPNIYCLKTKLDATSSKYIRTTGDEAKIKVDNKSGEYSRWIVDVSNSVSPFINSAVSNRYFALYSLSSSYFKAYTVGNASPTVLYRLTGTVAVRSREGYATFYTDRAFIMPEGLEGAIITKAENTAGNGGTLTLDWRYPAGSVVPANTGLLLKGEAGKTYVYAVVADNVAAPAGNLLCGSVEDDTTKVGNDTGENYKYYKLGYSAEGHGLGFYWGKESGAPFMNQGGRAYLALENGSVSSANGFSLSDMDATGISPVSTEDVPLSRKGVYGLSGVKLGQEVRSLSPGLYIVDGKKRYVK